MTRSAPSSDLTAPPEGATNIEKVRWAFDVINSHNVEPLREEMWKVAVEHLPGATLHGGQEVVDYFNDLFAAVPDLSMELKAVAEDGDNVLVRWVATGHFTGGSFQGIQATGSRLEFTGFDHFVFNDGVLVTNNVAYDRMLFAQQIGLLPGEDTVIDKTMKGAFNLKTQVASKLKR